MQIRIAVSKENYNTVRESLTSHGLEISEDAEYMITESIRPAAFLTVKENESQKLRLSAEEVIFIESFGKDVEVHTLSGTYHALDRMYQLEALLDPEEFLRISKSVIISRKHVIKIRPSFSMKYVLTLSDGTLVDVTRSYYSDFRSFYNI